MKPDEGFFSSTDGVSLFYRAWEKPAENALILIHGYGDHSGRYAKLISTLSNLPSSFYAFDMRGQGKSKGARVDADSFDQYVGDGYAFLDFLTQSKKLENRKFFLLGHSLGGLIAVRMLQRDEKRWKALLLSSPCFELYGISWSPILRFIANKLAILAPNLRMSNLVKPRYLFHGESEMEEYLKDKLIERRVTCRLADLIVKECLRAQTETPEFHVPVSVFASGDDRVVSLEATKRWFDRLRAPSKSIKIYPSLYHEIFNETSTQEPIEDVVSFLTSSMRSS